MPSPKPRFSHHLHSLSEMPVWVLVSPLLVDAHGQAPSLREPDGLNLTQDNDPADAGLGQERPRQPTCS